jgi:uncharacterized protein (UPF0335 family)
VNKNETFSQRVERFLQEKNNVQQEAKN